MAPATPAELCADCQVHTVLRALFRSAAPQEGCGLLIGRRLGPSWRLQWVWPCLNSWPHPEQRNGHFALDPREQLVAQKWARQRGLEVLGSAHSHPASAPLPSATDLRLALKPCLMVIGGPGDELRAWWLPEAPATPRQVPWRMVD